MPEPTMSVKIREWSDPLEEGRSWDDWPRPDEHVEYRITGHLADVIRAMWWFLLTIVFPRG